MCRTSRRRGVAPRFAVGRVHALGTLRTKFRRIKPQGFLGSEPFESSGSFWRKGDQTTLNNCDGMIGSKASLVDVFQSKSSVQVSRRKELGMVSLIRLQLKRVLRWQASIALASLACSALRWIQ